MAEHRINITTWPRADLFRLFRSYQKPHYAITSRVDVTHLIAARKQHNDISPYRACLYAIGHGVQAVPELRTRFRATTAGDVVVRHDHVALSMTVPQVAGGFTHAYVPYDPDFTRFEGEAKRLIDIAAANHAPITGAKWRDDVTYLSCLPWLDYTALDNPLVDATDCIPRISWGKFIDHGQHWDMAMTIEVHHALVDGVHLGAYFHAVQQALNNI